MDNTNTSGQQDSFFRSNIYGDLSEQNSATCCCQTLQQIEDVSHNMSRYIRVLGSQLNDDFSQSLLLELNTMKHRLFELRSQVDDQAELLNVQDSPLSHLRVSLSKSPQSKSAKVISLSALIQDRNLRKHRIIADKGLKDAMEKLIKMRQITSYRLQALYNLQHTMQKYSNNLQQLKNKKQQLTMKVLRAEAGRASAAMRISVHYEWADE